MPWKGGDRMEKFLTVAQAAAVLGVHPKTLRRWYATGRLRAYSIAPPGSTRHLVRLLAADVEALASEISSKPAPTG
jgi:excisionase family DNA binding protein